VGSNDIFLKNKEIINQNNKSKKNIRNYKLISCLKYHIKKYNKL
jgi:hypothetical protein